MNMHRQHHFILDTEPDDAEYNLLKTDISKLPGIIDFKQDGLIFHITYDFTQSNLKEISDLLSRRLSLKILSSLEQFLFTMKLIIEDNNRQHAANPAGWHYHIQQFYLNT